MKYIKRFNESKEDIKSICREYAVWNYTINEDGTIDVAGDVYLIFKRTARGLYKIPLTFNKVKGSFHCNDNNLTSLEGSPKIVGGSFDCRDNNLTTLEGGPKVVGSYFDCRYNKLTSLRGLPEDYEGNLLINDNPVNEIFNLIINYANTSDVIVNLLQPIEDGYSVKNYKIAHLLNEYDVISLDGKKIYLDNLEEVFNTLNMEMPKDIKLKNYEIH